MFHRIATLAIRWPRAVLALGIILVGLAGFYASGITSSLTTANGFIVKNSESDQVATSLSKTFHVQPASGLILFTGTKGLAATDPRFRAETARLLAPLTAAGATVIADNGTKATASFVSRDGKSSYAAVTAGGSDDAQAKVLTDWASRTHSSLLSVQLGGDEVAQQQSQTQVEHDLQRAELISFPILAILLLLIFRSVVAALLPLVLGGVAIFGGLAVTRFIAGFTTVDQYSVNVITLLGLGLSIDYSLLMVSRFREELAALDSGDEVRDAVRRTVLTSGRTIFFSGLTVITSLLTLLIFPISFLHSIGLGGASAILVAMLAALTILPALLHLIGTNVNRLAIIRPRTRPQTYVSIWRRLGRFTVTKPWWAIIGSVIAITALAYPLTQTHFVTQSFRFLPASSSSRAVAQALSDNFISQGDQIDIIVGLGQSAASPAGASQLATATSQIAAVSGVVSTSAPKLSGNTADITATTIADDAVARTTVRALRQLHPAGTTLQVGGDAAALNDTLSALYHRAPLAALIIGVAMMILLGLLVRSLVIPLQAIVINSFALLAAMGILVLVFQEGHIGPLTWLSPTYGLDPTIPVLILAIAFGLSMDYGAFLYSRMREEYSHAADTGTAIVTSLEHTGGIITAAAVLLVVVVGAFASSASAYIEQVGLGLSSAILVDAFIVRLFLVPAVMHQFGRYNWLAPKWLARMQIRHE